MKPDLSTPGLPTDGWTDEQRKLMELAHMDQHPNGQGQLEWVWSQNCPCRRCREEYTRVVAAQRRVGER